MSLLNDPNFLDRDLGSTNKAVLIFDSENGDIAAASCSGTIHVIYTNAAGEKVDETYTDLTHAAIATTAAAGTPIYIVGEVTELCVYSTLTAIDLRALRSLEVLDLTDQADMTAINLYGCKALTSLDLTDCTSLRALDLSVNTALETLVLSGCSALMALDLQKNTELITVDLYRCESIQYLDATMLTKLQSLDVAETQLQSPGNTLVLIKAVYGNDIAAAKAASEEAKAIAQALQAQVDSNTQAIEAIAVSGGASTAASVIFPDGENLAVKMARKTEKVRVDITGTTGSYQFELDGVVLNFAQLNYMLQESPNFVVFVHGNREHRCVEIVMEGNPKSMTFLAPTIEGVNVKAQSFKVISVDGTAIDSIKRTDILCENKTDSDALREKVGEQGEKLSELRQEVSNKVFEITEDGADTYAIDNNGNIFQSKAYLTTKPILIEENTLCVAEIFQYPDGAVFAISDEEYPSSYEVVVAGRSDDALKYFWISTKKCYLRVCFVKSHSHEMSIYHIGHVNNLIYTDLDEYVASDNIVIDAGSNTFRRISSDDVTSISYRVNKGDVVSAKLTQYSDTAALIFSQDQPAAGVSGEIIELGGGSTRTKNVYAVLDRDGYITLSYLTHSQSPISDFKIITTKSASVLELESLKKKVESLNPVSNSHVDFRPMFNFTRAQMQDSFEMENWSGNDVINNIYERLREEYPYYITRKVIGKCSDGVTDLYLYEFNNSCDEWFNLANRELFLGTSTKNTILPNTEGLTQKQCAIRKSYFDNYFSGKPHKGIYFAINFPVRKLSKWITREEVQMNNDTYYKFTFESDLKISWYQGEQNALEVLWTDYAITYDQHCMIISGIHGNEPAGYIGTALALKYMIEHRDENPTLNYIFNNVKLSVIPIVNMWGANQNPKVRPDYYGNNMNDWEAVNAEHTAIKNYIDTIKDELSFVADFHTSELWPNYGYVYAIPYPHTKIYPAIVSTANYLCRSWFPTSPAYNWNIGGVTTGRMYTSKFIAKTYGIPSTTVEFCGYDLMAFGDCTRWSAKYMTYAVENYLNYLISLCSMRIKNNSEQIINNDIFVKEVME